MAWTKQAREQVRDRLFRASLPFDTFRFKQDGTVECRHAYFYRHGMSPDKLAEKIKAAIPEAMIVDTEDRWAAWPKTSYFVVVFRVAAPEVVAAGREEAK